MTRKFLIFFFTFYTGLMFSKHLKEGIYRGVLIIDTINKIELPFNFEFKYESKKPIIIIHNADERIRVDEIKIKGDSLNFKMPIFDTEFRTKIVKNGLQGNWYNHYRKEKNTIKFIAEFNEAARFKVLAENPQTIFEGKWEVTFSPGKSDAYKAIGLFHHIEQTNLVHATFLTETGDYRYLEGTRKGQQIYLSCFDGSHAFLFIGTLESNQKIKAMFYSGAHHQEEWEATLNEKFELKNADEITIVKDANAKIEFSFINIDGKIISLSDPKFLNKPVLIQIMGSWCPNCMDESAYLSPIYKQYKDQGLEIIALAFEKTNDIEQSKKLLKRLQSRFNIEYDILITGQTGKNKASEIFPMLSNISAFPTLIFLNKNHQVVKIHTGFNGPATGKLFDDFKQNTEIIIHQLIHQ